MTEKINLQIPEELLEELASIAKAELKSVETVIINILAEYALNHQDEWGETNFEEAFTL